MANQEPAQLIESIRAVLARFGADAIGARTVEDAAREWIDAGFDDAEEVEDWLRAHCFNARMAREIESRGMTAEQASLRTGETDDVETIGYKLSRGEISFDEARRIINNRFWNS